MFPELSQRVKYMCVKELDCKEESHVEYWNCIESLCKHELNLAKIQESSGTGPPTDRTDRSTFTRERQFYVEDEIKNMLAGASLSR